MSLAKQYVDMINNLYGAEVLIEDDPNTYIPNDGFIVYYNYDAMFHINEDDMIGVYEEEFGVKSTTITEDNIFDVVEKTKVFKEMLPNG